MMVWKAAKVAAEAHAKQARKITGEPYVNHLIRVASDACAVGLGEEVIAAALLHDCVEDTAMTLAQLSREFPLRVVELVGLMTKWWDDQAATEVKAREKPKYYELILKDPEAVALKLLDRADNVRDMAKMLPRARKWAERYLLKTEQELRPLFERTEHGGVKVIFSEALELLRTELARQPGSPATRQV